MSYIAEYLHGAIDKDEYNRAARDEARRYYDEPKWSNPEEWEPDDIVCETCIHDGTGCLMEPDYEDFTDCVNWSSNRLQYRT